MRQSWLPLALCALMSLTAALDLGSLHIDGIESYVHHGNKRQASGSGNTTPTPTPTPARTSSNEESSEATSSIAPTSEAQSSSAPSQESSAAPTSNDAVTTSAPSSTAASTAGSSTRITTAVVKTTPLLSTSIQQYETVYTTIVNGQTQLSTALTSRTAVLTTGTALSTELPATQSGDGSSDNGLSTEKKNIIGGVVGGVGGALLLGGLAVVAWRIWGRKKRVSEDDDDLTFSTGSALGDKSSNASANTPFMTNLEQYHNPGRPNAAANF